MQCSKKYTPHCTFMHYWFMGRCSMKLCAAGPPTPRMRIVPSVQLTALTGSLGEGVWWHRESDGSFHFHDGSDYAVFSDAGPQLLHLRNARLDDGLEALECLLA